MSSCNRNKKEGNVESIRIDFSHVKEIDISDSSIVRTIPLELTDLSLLQEIQSVEFIDDKILVYNTDIVFIFDKDGRYLSRINNKGSGPGEYIRTTSFFVRQENIFLFDDILQKIFVYDQYGKFVSSVGTGQEEEFSLIYPLKTQGYVAKNKYRGKNNATPAICFLDEQLKKIRDVKNRFLQSGNIVFDNFYSFEKEILYWEFLNDTIYTVIPDGKVEPKFYVDFQDYKIPDKIRTSNDEDKILDYMNHSSNPKIATAIKYIQEDSLYMRFVFIQKEAILNYVRYEKRSRKNQLFRIVDRQGELVPQFFMLYKDGYIIMSVLNKNDYEENPQLIFINEEYI
jgi:hypothetical protein